MKDKLIFDYEKQAKEANQLAIEAITRSSPNCLPIDLLSYSWDNASCPEIAMLSAAILGYIKREGELTNE